MFKWLRILREPEVKEAGGINDFIGEAFDANVAESAAGGGGNGGDGGDDQASKDKADADAKAATDAKAKADDDARRAAEDPEYDVEVGRDDKKETKKYKLSQFKEIAQWLHNEAPALRQHAKLTGDLGKNPTFKKLFEGIMTGAYKPDGSLNEEYINTTATRLEAKAEAIQEAKDDIDEDIAEMEKSLADMDQETPAAKALIKSISVARKNKLALKASAAQIAALTKSVEGIEIKNKTAEEAGAVQDRNIKIAKARETFATEIAALTSKDKKDGFKFVEGTDEAERFDALTRQALVADDKAGKIKTDEDFIKAIRGGAKAAYDKIKAQREAQIHAYLKANGGKLPPKDGEVVPDKKPAGDVSLDLNGLIGQATAEVVTK